MAGFVDLHCHWVAEIDDGARSVDEGVEMLTRLKRIGFEHVVGTPHMRPGMFENDGRSIRAAFDRMLPHVRSRADLPRVSLGSEHFFDVDVVGAISGGAGLPYRGEQTDLNRDASSLVGGAILVEFQDLSPLAVIERQLFSLMTQGFIPVIAHPERYRAVWSDPETLARLVELGSVALLDVCAPLGKYGERAQKCARVLLEEGLYDAACTDSHRPADVEESKSAIEWLREHYGADELHYLFEDSPRRLLEGKRPEN